MRHALTMIRCQLGEREFPLLWNVRARADWYSSGLSFEAVDAMEPHAVGYILHIMSREAVAAMTAYGYQVPEGELPTLEELEDFVSSPTTLPWELTGVLESISEALRCGNHQDYKASPDGPGTVDISDQELKKN